MFLVSLPATYSFVSIAKSPSPLKLAEPGWTVLELAPGFMAANGSRLCESFLSYWNHSSCVSNSEKYRPPAPVPAAATSLKAYMGDSAELR